MVVTVTRVLAVLAALPSSMRVWTRTRRIETPYAVVVLAALCLVLLLAAFVVGFAWPASVVAVASCARGLLICWGGVWMPPGPGHTIDMAAPVSPQCA